MSIKMIDVSVRESQDGIYSLIRGWLLGNHVPAQRRGQVHQSPCPHVYLRKAGC
jgi:hypothetical protein